MVRLNFSRRSMERVGKFKENSVELHAKVLRHMRTLSDPMYRTSTSSTGSDRIYPCKRCRGHMYTAFQ